MESNTARELGADPVNPYAAPADAGAPVPQNDIGGELATPVSRLGAQILDGLLLVASFAPGAILGAILGSQMGSGAGAEESMKTFAIGLGMIGLLLFCGYQWRLVATSGQSLGKRWSHVRIVLDTGEPPGYWRGVILRSWALAVLRVIPMLGSLVGLLDSLMVFSEGRRCLHDRLAGTRVIKA